MKCATIRGIVCLNQNVGCDERAIVRPAAVNGFAAILLLVWSSCIVYAQQSDQQGPSKRFSPSAGQAFFLDLDSAVGAFSTWRNDDLGTMNSMRAVLSVPRLRKDSSWAPIFSIGLENNENEAARNNLWLQLIAVNGKTPMKVRLFGHIGGKPIQETPFQTTVQLNEDLDVVINWGADQIVTVIVGSAETRAIRIPWQIKSAVASSSTGQLKITRLLLGRLEP